MRVRFDVWTSEQSLYDDGKVAHGLEVLAGLEAGESIVISPLTRLTDGAAVAIGAAPGRTGGAS